MSRITAYFHAGPGSPVDKAVHEIFKGHMGEFVGAGTMLVGEHEGERDVQYDVPDEFADECREAFKRHHIRTETN